MTVPTNARRTVRSVALAAALGGGVAIGAATVVVPTATAAPVDVPRGMPMSVDRVLTPSDPAFWNLADEGVRVATRLEPGTGVVCSAGYQPPISCSLIPSELSRPQRPLSSVDVPRLGAAPLRVWFDTPRWGDGDTWRITERLLTGAS